MSDHEIKNPTVEQVYRWELRKLGAWEDGGVWYRGLGDNAKKLGENVEEAWSNLKDPGGKRRHREECARQLRQVGAAYVQSSGGWYLDGERLGRNAADAWSKYCERGVLIV
jgi:hypothetical protein